MNVTVFLWLICFGVLAMALWDAIRRKKSCELREDDVKGCRDFDFILNYRVRKGWSGTFFDGVVKYGVVTNLKEDSSMELSKGDVIRVTVDGMKDGLWQATVFTLSNLPRDTIVLTYKDDKGRWHCMYPGPQGVAMCGIVEHTPIMLVEKFVAGRVLRARCVADRHFEIV